MFSDEKIFDIQQVVNNQNDRIWLRNKGRENSHHLLEARAQVPASVMVWAAVTANGRDPLVFLPQEVKMNVGVYRELVLEGCLRPSADHDFEDCRFTFGQDPASPPGRATLNVAFWSVLPTSYRPQSGLRIPQT